jgi:hypothetical protein
LDDSELLRFVLAMESTSKHGLERRDGLDDLRLDDSLAVVLSHSSSKTATARRLQRDDVPARLVEIVLRRRTADPREHSPSLRLHTDDRLFLSVKSGDTRLVMMPGHRPPRCRLKHCGPAVKLGSLIMLRKQSSTRQSASGSSLEPDGDRFGQFQRRCHSRGTHAG